jgi:hypothetical protein
MDYRDGEYACCASKDGLRLFSGSADGRGRVRVRVRAGVRVRVVRVLRNLGLALGLVLSRTS